MLEHAYLIPLAPFIASLIILLAGKEDENSPLPFLGIGTMAYCLIHAVAIFAGMVSGSIHGPFEARIPWMSIPVSMGGKVFSYEMPLGVLIDAPAAVMLVVVSLVSLLVQIYSLAYMHGDKRFKRFYAYLSFFSASMLGLVVSNNILVTFMCWELMGVSSYLLIGFWFEKPSAAYACKKAFMTTRLGDCGLYLALLLIFAQAGTFSIAQLKNYAAAGYLAPAAACAIALGLLAGAAGKSAQFPLLIWLPDAMEGPTPVSALIHAATMVAAGIYLVARCYFIFVASPLAMEVVAWTGLLTAFSAATMALVAYDIKRVLAFSTVSQLGFMMCALGCGGYTAGLFHLTTHAFFKALLFLGAGSVIHAVHTNDMREMGGLSKKMPITFLTMLIATAAIAGLPPLSGYYSKDMILETVLEHSKPMFALLTFSALLTAFYMFRLICLTFLGKERDADKHHHAHESPAPMTTPLIILAVPSVLAGFLLHHGGLVNRLLHFQVGEAAHEAAAHHAVPWLGPGVTALALCAIALAWRLYGRSDFSTVDRVKSTFMPVFKLLENRWGLDEAFLALVKVSDKAAKAAFWFDSQVIDRIFVDGWALVSRIMAEISHLFDAAVVDKTVDGFGSLSWDLGIGLRSLVKDGQVQEYLMYLAVAFSLFATLAFMR